MTEPRRQSNIDFRLMSIAFCLRDWLRPPAGILENAGVRSGMAVLDFGCGPGGFSIAAAKIVGRKGRVYAVDIHPLALKAVRKAAEKNGLNNIQAVSGSSMAAVGDETIDAVLLYDILHGLAEPAPVLGELHRVLKPGGILSVKDHHLKEAGILAIVTAHGLYRFADGNKTTFRFVKNQEGKSGI